MRKKLWAVATAALFLTGGALAAQAQQRSGPSSDRPSMMSEQGGDAARPGMAGDGGRPGMMMGQGQGMMGSRHGSMRGDRRQGGIRHGMGGPGMMAMMMILMDENADRAVSLDEFQAAHARIFKYADANDDGKLTTEEMRGFMRGLHGGDDDDD